MPPERGIEEELARRLHAELDHESGPHPTWSDSRASSWPSRRSPAARPWVLVMVTLVLATGLLGGLILAGGANQPVPSRSSPPSRSMPPSPTEDLVVALHRPLRIPAMAADGGCPQTPLGLTLHFGVVSYASGGVETPSERFQGQGPVYVENLYDLHLDGLPLQDGWRSQKVFWAIDAREPGAVLVRVARIDGRDAAGLGDANAPELLLQTTNVASDEPFRIFDDGASFGVPGCYVMQMDGVSTTSTVVFRVLGPTAPAPTSSPRATPPWAALAARPLSIPAYSGSCGVGPAVTPDAAFDRGLGSSHAFLVADAARPVALGPGPQNADGTWQVKSVWVVTGAGAARYPAPVIVRGARIDGPGQVQFEGGVEPQEGPLMYLAGESGIYSTGLPSTWQEWVTYVDYPGPGCYVLQVDGDAFTQQITIEVLP